MMEKAIEIPLGDCGLSITSGRDGCWLHFSTLDGKHTSINVEDMVNNYRGIIGRSLLYWCAERHTQAAKIREDNGQFGVGA